MKRQSTKARNFFMTIGLCVTFALGAGAQTADTLDSPASILEKLRSLDSTTLDGGTLEARVLAPRSLLANPDTERLKTVIRVTSHEGAWASRARTAEDLPLPKYQDPVRAGMSSSSSDHKVLVVFRPSERVTLSEPAFRGNHTKSIVYEVAPDGSIRKQAPAAPCVCLGKPGYPFDDSDSDLYIPTLCSGRGFSYFIDSIDEASRLDDGRLHVLASGKFVNGSPARWELWLDPAADYLARKAMCTQTKSGGVLVEIENTGLLNRRLESTSGEPGSHLPSAPSREPQFATRRPGGLQEFDRGCLPKEARLTLLPASRAGQPESAWEIEFLSLDDKPDLELIAQARDLLKGEFPRGTQVRDQRQGPQTLTYTAGGGPGEARRGDRRAGR